jgi:hypothetical protein
MVGVKLYDEAREIVQELADRETNGNLSEMVRKLMSEALEARKIHKR